jgi:hypothetical protein
MVTLIITFSDLFLVNVRELCHHHNWNFEKWDLHGLQTYTTVIHA